MHRDSGTGPHSAPEKRPAYSFHATGSSCCSSRAKRPTGRADGRTGAHSAGYSQRELAARSSGAPLFLAAGSFIIFSRRIGPMRARVFVVRDPLFSRARNGRINKNRPSRLDARRRGRETRPLSPFRAAVRHAGVPLSRSPLSDGLFSRNPLSARLASFSLDGARLGSA